MLDKASKEAEIWKILVSETRNYVHKNGFQKVVLGLSGGIDSSLTAVLAVEALGRENVLGVLMPSFYSSKQSIEDTEKLIKNLGIKRLIIPIDNIIRTFDRTLKNIFTGYPKDVTEENIQSRIRCVLLMALSNKFHALLLATGNKSELFTGYCTLYGDLAGGLAPLGDIFKTQVYRLARWLNKEKGNVIPVTILEKEPSAELKPGQKDTDVLPPYKDLDQILEKYLEFSKSVEDIKKDGFSKETVQRVVNLVKKSEFKRKQAPPVIKIPQWKL